MILALIAEAASVLSVVLAVSGGSILVVQIVRRRRVWRSSLMQRWLTWSVLAPLWLIASSSPVPRIGLLTSFAVVASLEYGRLQPAMVVADRLLLALWATIAVPSVAIFDLDPFVVVIAGSLAGTVMPLLTQDVRRGTARIGHFVTGVVLIVAPLVLLHQVAIGISVAAFFALGVSVAISDVSAFVIGKSLGDRRFAMTLSPNKTVAGLAGNVIGAVLAIAGLAVTGIVGWEMTWLIPLVVVGSVGGDLLISLFKRTARVKDAGTWLPGFGGLLDRIDSLLATTLLVVAIASSIGLMR